MALLGRVLCLLVAFALVFMSFLPVPQAEAQQRPKTIVDMLFGGGSRASEPPPRVIKKRVIRKKKRSTVRQKPAVTRKSTSTTQKKSAGSGASATSASAETSPQSPAGKKENARTILVVGDFMAGGLADGLETFFAADDTIKVTDKTNGSSGLVREDYYDWPANLGPLIEDVEPDVLAVMIGANDRQPMTVSGNTLSVRSNGWTAEYERRATDLAKIAKEKNVPVIWVGMPSFKFDSMSEDMVFFNDIYRRAAERASGEFVSIWDGYVDEQGSFVYSGPDVNGQTTRLRTGDGISMTEAGREKLAFFTDKALDRVLGDVAPQIALDDESLPKLGLQPLSNAANARVSAPVALGDPSLDGSEALLGTGADQTAFSLELSPRDRLVLNGDQVDSRDGRADDFAWNTKTNALPSEKSVVYSGRIDLRTINRNAGIEPPKEMPTIFDAIIEDWENANSGGDGAETEASGR